MTSAIALRETTNSPVKALAIQAYARLSSRTQKEYTRAIESYWQYSGGRLDRETVQAYAAREKARGIAAVSVNQQLSAIRTLAKEAGMRGLLDHQTAYGIAQVANEKKHGQKLGNWLTEEQAIRLVQSIKGQRDKALVGLLLGAGLRRTEALLVKWAHIQYREGRMVAEIHGKGNKPRVIAIPKWAEVELLRLKEQSYLGQDMAGAYVFGGISGQRIYEIVVNWAKKAGYEFSPHDLRRSFARIARNKGASLESIQAQLGHSSIVTTSLYVGQTEHIKPGEAACDRWNVPNEKESEEIVK